MNDPLTCDVVEEHDLVAKYVAGRLAEEDAQRLEAHCLECETCWTDLRLAMKVRGATRPALESSAGEITTGHTSLTWSRRAPAALAAAAVVLLAAGVALWELRRPQPSNVERGAASLGDVRVRSAGDQVSITWSPVEGASRYKVDVIAADGRLMSSREGSDPHAEVPRHPLTPGTVVTVEAFSALGDKLAASAPVPLR